jgi:VIT1/CCC1 family predicted Fe2+/Mn2+ transporter
MRPILSIKEDDFAMETAANNKIPEGMGGRVAATILTFFGSIIGIILWLFYYAGNFNVYQNIAIVVVILLSFMAVMGATWASWGMKQAAKRSKKED